MRHIGDVIRESFPHLNGKAVSGSYREEESYDCPICHDAGYLRMDVPVGHPNFGRLFPCSCTIKKQEQRHANELRRLSNLDALADLTFANFDPNAEGLSEAYKVAKAYAADLQGWIFFHGRCGVGKTHLAVAIAREVMEQEKLSVYFAVVPDLLDQLRASFDPSAGVAYEDRFRQIRDAHLLVLDDLGTEATSPWAREKLYQLLNQRYIEQRPTVVTSNQSFEHLDERIVSRLCDSRLTRYCWIDAEDYRTRDFDRSGSFRRQAAKPARRIPGHNLRS
jgi:DNA replication protein DnaC